eukprot:209438-Prymnesium_polylepis.1
MRKTTTFFRKNDTPWRSAGPWPAGPRAMPACHARPARGAPVVSTPRLGCTINRQPFTIS